MHLAQQIQTLFELPQLQLEHLDIPVNDVVKIITPSAIFALKIYNTGSRTLQDVQWELDLTEHLVKHGAPVVRPVRGKHGYVETLTVEGQARAAALFEWLPGAKPQPSHQIYTALGEAAARIHTAADSFKPPWTRDTYDATRLIDEQIQRMKRHLVEADRYDNMMMLSARLQTYIADPKLNQGFCHMDLTLDNVHQHNGALTVFDFDSSGWSWRAIEAWGVLRFSDEYFHDWLQGYRTVRPFSAHDESAVAAFGIVGDIRNIVWKLGEARSSRGKPQLTAADLPTIVDGWLAWEQEKILHK